METHRRNGDARDEAGGAETGSRAGNPTDASVLHGNPESSWRPRTTPESGRLPASQRVGQLSHDVPLVEILGENRKGLTIHGYLDELRGIAQFGGEIANTRRHQWKALTFSARAIDQVKDQAAQLQFIDHPRNRSWTCEMAVAIERGWYYDSPLGRRFAVPEDCFWIEHGDLTPAPQPRPDNAITAADLRGRKRAESAQLSLFGGGA